MDIFLQVLGTAHKVMTMKLNQQIELVRAPPVFIINMVVPFSAILEEKKIKNLSI